MFKSRSVMHTFAHHEQEKETMDEFMVKVNAKRDSLSNEGWIVNTGIYTTSHVIYFVLTAERVDQI